jgi:hypothetical protein
VGCEKLLKSEINESVRRVMARCSSVLDICLLSLLLGDIAIATAPQPPGASPKLNTVAALIIELLNYIVILQYLLPIFSIFEVLEGPIHGVNNLEKSSCTQKAQGTMQKHHSAQRCLLVQ